MAEIIRPDVFEERAKQLLWHGDGNGHDGGMPPEVPERVAVLETHMQHVRDDISESRKDIRDIRTRMDTDFRVTWGGMILATLGLAALMAKGFKWI